VATGNVEITATGRVNGNIETDSLVISKGGFFNGNVVKTGGREPKAPVYLVEDKRVASRGSRPLHPPWGARQDRGRERRR